WADLLVGGQAQGDRVHLGQGAGHQLVQPLPGQGPGPVHPGGVHQDQLDVRAVHDAADGVPGGLRPAGGDRHLLPDQRVGQRRLPGVRAADHADESGAEVLRWGGGGQLVLAVVLSVDLGHGDCPSRASAAAGEGALVAPPVAGSARQTRRVCSRRRRPWKSNASRQMPWVQARDPWIGTRPSALVSSPAAVVTSSSSMSMSKSSPSSSSPNRAGTTNVPSSAAATSSSSASCSSTSSPTSSSRMSSTVTRPATPPYSSTTTAMCTDPSRISSSRSSTTLVSGTNNGGRITSSTRLVSAWSVPLRTARARASLR